MMFDLSSFDLIPPEPHKPPKILIVDDEEDIRLPLTHLLKLEGYPADHASSGTQALELLNKNPYNLMILDMHMPEMPGTVVMEQLNSKFPDLLIIVLTGKATIDNAISAVKKDVVIDYLQKPISNDEFLKVIAEVREKQNNLIEKRYLATVAEILGGFFIPPWDQHSSKTLPDTSFDAPAPEKLLHTHPLTLDQENQLVIKEDYPEQKIIKLSKGETSVLHCLMSHPQTIFSYKDLVQKGLGQAIQTNVEAANTARSCISRLRKKLNIDAQNPRIIHTVRGRGYCFRPPN